MGSSMGTGDDLPAVSNAAVDLIACDGEVWCEALRTTLIAYLPVQRVKSEVVTSTDARFLFLDFVAK